MAVAVLTAFFAGSAFAATVSPDVMVSPPPLPGQVWYNTAQAEPAVAANPTNPDNIIVGYADFRGEPPCFFAASLQHTVCQLSPTGSLDGLAVSFDGGVSWKRSLLPPNPAANAMSVHGDEIVAFGPLLQSDGSFKYLAANGAPAARAYYLSLSNLVAGDPQWSVNIFTSDDQGVTWSGPRIISLTNALKESGFREDKPYMTVDTNPSSPNFGHVYIGYTNLTKVGTR